MKLIIFYKIKLINAEVLENQVRLLNEENTNNNNNNNNH